MLWPTLELRPDDWLPDTLSSCALACSRALGLARSAGQQKKAARFPTCRTPKGLAPKSQEMHGPLSVIVTDFMFAVFDEVIYRVILGPFVFSGAGCGGQRHFTTWLAGGRDPLRGLNLQF